MRKLKWIWIVPPQPVEIWIFGGYRRILQVKLAYICPGRAWESWGKAPAHYDFKMGKLGTFLIGRCQDGNKGKGYEIS